MVNHRSGLGLKMHRPAASRNRGRDVTRLGPLLLLDSAGLQRTPVCHKNVTYWSPADSSEL